MRKLISGICAAALLAALPFSAGAEVLELQHRWEAMVKEKSDGSKFCLLAPMIPGEDMMFLLAIEGDDKAKLVITKPMDDERPLVFVGDMMFLLVAFDEGQVFDLPYNAIIRDGVIAFSAFINDKDILEELISGLSSSKSISVGDGGNLDITLPLTGARAAVKGTLSSCMAVIRGRRNG